MSWMRVAVWCSCWSAGSVLFTNTFAWGRSEKNGEKIIISIAVYARSSTHERLFPNTEHMGTTTKKYIQLTMDSPYSATASYAAMASEALSWLRPLG